MAALMVVLFVALVISAQKFTEACEARGGHIHTATGIGVGRKGPVTTYTDMCLSADGRVLE